VYDAFASGLHHLLIYDWVQESPLFPAIPLAIFFPDVQFLAVDSIAKKIMVVEDVIETLRLQKMLEEHTIEYTKISVKKLEKIYKGKKDWYIDTDEALKLKIIDEVIS
jgi:hypothetical protein